MDYGKVLKDAWNTIWKNKILWLLGILAGCGSNSGRSSFNGNSSSPNFNYSYDNGDFSNFPPEAQHFFDNFSNFIDKNAGLLWLYVLIIFLIIMTFTLIAFFLRVYGTVGLVRGTMLANDGSIAEIPATTETEETDEANEEEAEKTAKLSFSQIHAEVGPYFWRLAGLRALLFLAGLVIGLVVAGVIILGTVATFGIGMICLIPLICLMVPIGWAITVLIKQAELAIIVEDLTFTDALRRGYQVVRAYPGPYAIMALILLVGAGIVGFIFAIPQILAMAPVFAAVMSSAMTEDFSNMLTGLWISIACLVAYWPVITVLKGILNSYVESSWVLTFLEVKRMEENPDDPQMIEPELEPA